MGSPIRCGDRWSCLEIISMPRSMKRHSKRCLMMPLCRENIFALGLPRPAKPENLDSLAYRAREFLELVIQGVQV